MAPEEASSSGSAVAPAPATTPADSPADSPTTAPAPDQDAASAPAPAPAPAKAKAKSKAPAKTTAKGKASAASKSYNSYNDDPALWIYTSLTAGNMHILTATSRLETILRANRVPFKAVDLAVDDRARMLWGRRAGKAADGRVRRLPALVQMGKVLGVSEEPAFYI